MDLRLGADDQELGCDLTEFDVFLACYVLHENASHMLVGGGDEEQEKEQEVGGCVLDMLVRAKSGAVMLCCDASNRQWPAMSRTAEKCGWQVDESPEKRVESGGPKSCWFAVKK